MKVIDYFIYEAATGKLMQTGTCVEADFDIQVPPEACVIKRGKAQLFDQYFDTGTSELREFPVKPSNHHVWDWITKGWIAGEAEFDAAKTAKKAAVSAIRVEKNLAPISYAGALFDADSTAQSNVMAWMVNISSGGSVPLNFVWRDANNVDHPADSEFIIGLGAEMALRGSWLYRAQWAHKANIDSMTTIEEVESYDVSVGWLE